MLRVVDEQGFWEYGASTQNLPGWLLLGDSVTMGMGVEADSTFAGRLASVQGQYDILNPSLPGHASNDYLEIVRVVIAERDVARVTLFWCLNDVMGGTPIETAPEGTRLLDNPVMAFVRKHIRTYTWAKATFTDRSKAYFLHDRDLYERDGSLFEDSMADVRAIRSLLQTTNIPFHVVLLPYEYELRNREEEPRSSLQNRFESMGIQVLSLADEMAWEDPSRYYLYGDGIHLSVEGHREIAERVNAFLPTIRE